MSQVYKCDSCGTTSEEMHDVRMKEFFYDVDLGDLAQFGQFLPYPSKRKIKVHICHDCFMGLKHICEKVKEEQKNGVS